MRAYQPFSEALDKSLGKNLRATDVLLSFVERLLAATTEHLLSPALLNVLSNLSVWPQSQQV